MLKFQIAKLHFDDIRREDFNVTYTSRTPKMIFF